MRCRANFPQFLNAMPAHPSTISSEMLKYKWINFYLGLNRLTLPDRDAFKCWQTRMRSICSTGQHTIPCGNHGKNRQRMMEWNPKHLFQLRNNLYGRVSASFSLPNIEVSKNGSAHSTCVEIYLTAVLAVFLQPNHQTHETHSMSTNTYIESYSTGGQLIKTEKLCEWTKLLQRQHMHWSMSFLDSTV